MNNKKYWIAFLLLIAIFALAPLAESVGAFSWDRVRYTYSEEPVRTPTAVPIQTTAPTPTPAPTRGVDRVTEAYCSGTAKTCDSFTRFTAKCDSQDGCISGPFAICTGTAKACNTYTAEPSCDSQRGCSWILPTCIDSDDPKTVTLFTGQQTTFFCNVVELDTVFSNTPVIIDVDGVVETVTGTETVNGIKIAVVGATYAENTADKSAVLVINSVEYSMDVGDVITVSGKQITLKNVGSATSAMVEITSTDNSVTDTVSGIKKTVNNIDITVASIRFKGDVSDWTATLTLS